MAGPTYPGKILQQPFNYSGVNRNNIPLASASPNASYQDGFPPVTMEAVGSGGIPPAGQDFNGIFYDLSDLLVWLNAGGLFTWNSTFAGAVGYPLGAVLMSNDGTQVFKCLQAGAATDPNTFANVDGIHWGVVGTGNYQVDTGAANAYAITTTPPTNTLYKGQVFRFKAAHASTGASTLNVGTGAVTLLRQDGTAIGNGDLQAGAVYSVVYDLATTSFFLTAPVAAPIANAGLYAVDGTNTNTYAITTSTAFPLETGSEVSFKVTNQNTLANASVTLAVNGGSALQVVRTDGSGVSAHDLAAGPIYTVVYTGSKWQLTGPVASQTTGIVRASAKDLHVAAINLTAVNAPTALGLGNSGVDSFNITPSSSGTVLINASLQIENQLAGTGHFNIIYGQGAAGSGPAQGATSGLGTNALGSYITWGEAAGAQEFPMSVSALVTGLTPGLPYWFDLTVDGTSTMGNLSMSQTSVTIVEI